MKNGLANRWTWAAAAWLAALACAWGVELPRAWEREAGPRTTIEEYYADCYGADGQLLQGAELKAALCRIVNTGVRTNSFSDINSILRETDVCPTNSEQVLCIYMQCGLPRTSFEKEFLWPESRCIDGTYPAYSDLHHLRASSGTMRIRRGSLDFDQCRGEEGAAELKGCWYTSSAWEPPDAAKGDIARAVLYMDVRYETGANPNGDLAVVEAVGTGPGTNVLGRLSTLLEWNELDPVDDFERTRHELIYAKYQRNRNPFIDHPEWVRRVFEPEKWNGKAGAAVVVTNLEARQRYPWNGLVDIDYEVSVQGWHGEETVWVDVSGVDGKTGQGVDMRSLTGSGAAGPVKTGKHRMTWDMGEDAPELVSDRFAVKMFAGAKPVAYWVVDMSGGPSAEKWDMETWEGEPVGGWTEEYKTSQLVLRRIEAGTFTMGSHPEELGRQADEEQHAVTLSAPYCMGVFEVTQGQWEQAMGTRPSAHPGATRPVEGVAYESIRGGSAGTGWPDSHAVDAGSFLGVLRSKTGIEFDLPTEAQWEHACRAGTETALNSGKDLTGLEECGHLAEVARYLHNQDDGRGGYGEHAEAGSYLPNAWGLYDMHGNVAEWCLDWYGVYETETATNPTGATAGDERVLRGGDWNSAARNGRSAWRGHAAPSASSSASGFRLACNAGNAKAQRMTFSEIGAHAVNESLDLTARAASGGEVEFSVVSGPGVVEGSKLAFSATGTVVVRARQAGNADWWPVTAEQAVSVYRAGQKLDFAPIGSQTAANRVELSATATGGGPVEFSVVSGPGMLEDNVLSFSEPGMVTVSAIQAGDDYWAPVAATQTVHVVDEGLLYAVRVDADIPHGTVEAAVAAASEGETVTLTVVPETGWKLRYLTLNGERIKGTAFSMPARDVTVSAVFKEWLTETYAPVEREDEFEIGGEYLFVAHEPGVYTSAMRNGKTASRIGIREVKIGEDGTIITDDDSIVWKIEAGTEEDSYTIYNDEADVYAASPSSQENHAQLLSDGTARLAQWTLNPGSLPQAEFYSVMWPDRWLSRNMDAGNAFYAAYQGYGVLPRLYKRLRYGEIDVRFDKSDDFVVDLGKADSITACARNGTAPYSFVWSSAETMLNGTGPTLAIPAALLPGKYAVQVEATDAEARQTVKTIHFSKGGGRVQDFDAWSIHDSFARLDYGWLASRAKTVQNEDLRPKTAGGLLISKYIEGANNDKAIELYNGTTNAIDLAKYELREYDNGATTATRKMKLAGTLAPKSCAIVTRAETGPNPPDEVLQAGLTIRTNALRFNGDDVVVLYYRGAYLDRVGQVDTNASHTHWAKVMRDHTLVRKASVTNGTSGAITGTFDLGQWNVLEKGDFGDVGRHSFDGDGSEYWPAGLALCMAANSTLTLGGISAGGVGDVDFWYRAWEGAATLVAEMAPDETSTSWTEIWRTNVAATTTNYVHAQFTASGVGTGAFRIRTEGGAALVDEINVGEAMRIKRKEHFRDWDVCTPSGLYTRNQWTVQGQVNKNGESGSMAAVLSGSGEYVQSPFFTNGVGLVEFKAGSVVSYTTGQLSLSTSTDGGATWETNQTWIISTKSQGTNLAHELPLTAQAAVRLAWTGGSALYVDDVYVQVPTAPSRAMTFDSLTPTSSYKDYSMGIGWWTITKVGVYANEPIGNCGLMNGAQGSTISSPRLEELADISFQFKYWTGMTAARLTVEVSADGMEWTTLTTTAGEGGSDSAWSHFSTNVEPNAYHYVRIFPTQSQRIYIDEIMLPDPSESSHATSMARAAAVPSIVAANGSKGSKSGRASRSIGMRGWKNAKDGLEEEADPVMIDGATSTNPPTPLDGWAGQTEAFRVDARAGSGDALEMGDAEWVTWDTAWNGAERTEVTLERPDGTLEPLGGGEGTGVSGRAEWVAGADEWGTFTLRCMSWDAEGTELGELLALRVRVKPSDGGYAAWLAARGGNPSEMPMDGDADGDGASNWEEYVADSDPWNADEVFKSLLVEKEDGTFRVEPSVVSTGRVYRVKRSGDVRGDWEWLELGPGREDIGADLGEADGRAGFGAVGVSMP